MAIDRNRLNEQTITVKVRLFGCTCADDNQCGLSIEALRYEIQDALTPGEEIISIEENTVRVEPPAKDLGVN